MDFSSMFGGGSGGTQGGGLFGSGPIQRGSWRSVLGALGAGIQDVYSNGRGNNLALYARQQDEQRRRAGAGDFITSLIGQNTAPSFAGPSAPGYSGVASPQPPAYNGPLADIIGQKQTGALAPILSGLAKSGDPELAQSFVLPMLLKQFEQKPDYTMGRSRYSGNNELLATAPADPVRPEATPDIIQTATYLFPNDPVKRSQYILQNSPAAVKGIFAPKTVKPTVPGAVPITNPAALFRGGQ